MAPGPQERGALRQRVARRNAATAATAAGPPTRHLYRPASGILFLGVRQYGRPYLRQAVRVHELNEVAQEDGEVAERGDLETKCGGSAYWKG